MSNRRRLARLERASEERRNARENVCTCRPVIFIEGEPTEEQQAELDALTPCKLHSDAVRVYEAPPMPDWMKNGTERPPRVIED